MKDVFANSICMKDYLEANEAVEAGNVWVNREVLEGYPMCMKSPPPAGAPAPPPPIPAAPR